MFNLGKDTNICQVSLLNLMHFFLVLSIVQDVSMNSEYTVSSSGTYKWKLLTIVLFATDSIVIV